MPSCDALEPGHLARDQGGARRQDEGQRHLDDDERVTQPPVARGSSSCGRRRRRPPRASARAALSAGARPKSTAVATQTTSTKTKARQSSATSCARGSLSAPTIASRPAAPLRDDQPRRRAGRRQQQALGQRLPHQAPPPGAERRAGDHVAHPAAHAREQQVRDVRARRGEHQAHRGKQHPQRPAHRSDHHVGERHRRTPTRTREPGVCASTRLAITASSACAASHVTPGLEPPDDARPAAPEGAARLGAQRRRRQPDVGARLGQRARHDGRRRCRGTGSDRGMTPSIGVRPPLERHDTSGQRRVAAEAVAPQPGADDRDVERIAVAERPPDDRVDAEQEIERAAIGPGRRSAARARRRRRDGLVATS